jgi:flagellin
MSISINNNMLSLNVANTFNKNTVGLQNSMTALSTGQRINYAGDDPSGMGISERITTRIRSLDQGNVNVQNDSAIMKIADNALANMADILGTIRQRAVQAANDSTTTAERTNLVADMKSLVTSYDNVLKEATYGGKSFFDSSTTNTFGKDGFNVQYGPDATNTLKFSFTDLTSGKGTAAKAMLTEIGKIKDAATAQAAITKIDDAFNAVATEQTNIGTMEQRLGYLAESSEAESLALTELNSSIRDTDVAKGMTEFMKYNIRTQASQFMLAQAGQVPAMVLQLLQP